MSVAPKPNTSDAPANPVSELPFPAVQSLVQAAKLGQQQDRPIQLDYYADTALGKAVFAEDKDTKEKVLMKSRDEFTSLVQKVYKVPNAEDYLVLTENSIYLVSGKVQKRSMNLNEILGANDY